MLETRMNIASLCRLASLGSLPYQCAQRFDTEEVAGSNPVVPTNIFNKLSRSKVGFMIFCVMGCVITHHSSAVRERFDCLALGFHADVTVPLQHLDG